MNRRTICLAIYLILLHLCLAGLLLFPSMPGKTLQRIGLRILRADTAGHYNTMLIVHSRIDDNVPSGSVLFIGDSIVESLCVRAVTDEGINFGIGTDTTDGVVNRIIKYSSIKRAKAVVLSVGLNDIKIRANDKIIENYKTILSIIPSRIPVLVNAVLPTDEGKVLIKRNERIVAINNQLRILCLSVPNCHFVNSHDKLADDTGNLNPNYHVGDGVHLSAKGYHVWIEDLRNGLKRLYAQGNCILRQR